LSIRTYIVVAAVLGVASLAGCGGADGTSAGPGSVPVEQWPGAVKIARAAWDGNRTLTLTVEGDLAKAPDLAPVIVWGYVKHGLPADMFEMPLPSGRKLKIGSLNAVALEVASPSDGPPTVLHQVSFIPFRDAADPDKGGVIEFVATSLRSTGDPQTFALAMPVYRARGRMDWFVAPVKDLRPVVVMLAPSPYAGAKLPDNVHLGVDDLPPDPPHN
jgi:hypothetical protein